jgi:hypothetical protein
MRGGLVTIAAAALLAACGSSSQVAELAPGILGLTARAGGSAASARLGVERARAHCERQGREFEPVRSEIGASEYRIAFRCTERPDAAPATPLLGDVAVPPYIPPAQP